MSDSQVLPIVVAGGAALGLYHLWWLPYRARLEVERLALEAAAANVRAGMGPEEAIQQALAGACRLGATAYKVPPSVSGPLCSAAGVVAEKLGKAVGKGAIVGGKKIGAGTVVAAKAVGHTTKAAASGARKAARWLGLGALPYELAAFDAPPARPAAAGPATRKRRSQATIYAARYRDVPGEVPWRWASPKPRRPSLAAAGAAYYLRHLE
jgi:hypothetical protein